MNDRQIAALVKKTVAKAAGRKPQARRTYDATLDATRTPENADDEDRKEFFKEMKRREF